MKNRTIKDRAWAQIKVDELLKSGEVMKGNIFLAQYTQRQERNPVNKYHARTP